MTNRELIELCNSLTAQLHNINSENQRLKKELEQYSFKENFNTESVDIEENVPQTEPEAAVNEAAFEKPDFENTVFGTDFGETDFEKAEPETPQEAKYILPDEFKIGAETIGKLVVCSAVFANRLTPGGKSDNRELVNLILGQTEAAKLEIFEIAMSDCELSEKSEKMSRCCAEAEEYFKEVLRQSGECEK